MVLLQIYRSKVQRGRGKRFKSSKFKHPRVVAVKTNLAMQAYAVMLVYGAPVAGSKNDETKDANELDSVVCHNYWSFSKDFTNFKI